MATGQLLLLPIAGYWVLGLSGCTDLSATNHAGSNPNNAANNAVINAVYNSINITVEEARLPQAIAALPAPLANLDEQALQSADQQWRQAVKQTQADQADDRPLYWQRLASQQQRRRSCPRERCAALLKAFELGSRGAKDISYSSTQGLRLLITGFDPFALDRDITQSNPSGLLALQLDNRTLTHQLSGQRLQIQSLIFPVRFADFDAGIVEELLTPLIQNQQVDAIITLSMGRDGFDLERFPGKRRGTTATDNNNLRTGASASNPLVPLLAGRPILGPEFVEFSLPVTPLLAVQHPFAVVDNHQVRTLEDGAITASSLASLKGKTAVAGSGGAYLSNEVSYRSRLLGQQLDPSLPIGHIHLPRLTGYNKNKLHRISQQLEQMLVESIPALTKLAGR